jgi:tRNA (guanine37-N1)-methyltransferase
MRFDVITLFPELFRGFVEQGILGRAVERGLVSIHARQLRDHSQDRLKRVDDRPYGGGPGMVLAPDPVFRAVEAARLESPRAELVALTPGGERLKQPRLVEWAARRTGLILLCGRYEGFDERVFEGLRPRLVSIGDYVTNGGEIPAMVVIEGVTRLIPGALGDDESVREESHASPGEVEYPQYTRPPVYRGMAVPETLLGGNHAEIARWRAERAKQRTEERAKREREQDDVDQRDS